MEKQLLQILSAQLKSIDAGIIITGTEQVFGGDINETFLLTTTAGKYFLKTNRLPYADIFEKESHGLNLLRDTKIIAVPKPLLHGSHGKLHYLVLEYMQKGNPVTGFWEEFAVKLALLHQCTQTYVGLQQDNYIGSIPQSNQSAASWAEFYAARRILPLVQMAFDKGYCSSADHALAEKLCNRLTSLLPTEKPALLHGDLWSGNFLVNKEGIATIYDPAVYYGHREMDIAMTLLFGGFDKKFYTAYHTFFPLEKGWQERAALFQLYPLLVHLILFGGHYYTGVVNILKKYT